MRRSGAHKSLGAPWTSMFKMEKGNYVQSFYYYNFIHTILCKLVGSTTSAQFTTAERQDCALKQWSKTHLTLRQSSSTIPKTSGCANVASNSRAEKACGWDGGHPGWQYEAYLTTLELRLCIKYARKHSFFIMRLLYVQIMGVRYRRVGRYDQSAWTASWRTRNDAHIASTGSRLY